MAAPLRPLRLALPLAGIVAILAAAPLEAQRPDVDTATAMVTATVEGSVKKPRPATRSTQSAGRASKLSVRKLKKLEKLKKVAKRPVRARPPVKRADPDTRPKPAAPANPNDPLWSGSWSLARTNAAAAWSLTSGAPETVVAILDTGVDLSHPDLQGSLVQGYDVVNRDDDPTDDHGHGTMVAGVVAARANNGLGGVGACSRCSVMPVKVIAANGSGNAADVAEGIRWATDHGAQVLNLSFTLSGSDESVAQAIDYARGKGVVVVAAAGNAGTADVTFPASYPGVVGVAGTDVADARYDWSSYGGWVRLAAPGCNLTTAPGAGYGDFCGTSSATAFVSGIAGLVRSFAPNLSPDAIEQALAGSALRVGDFVSAGRVDAGAALGALQAARAAGSAPAVVADTLVAATDAGAGAQ